MNSSISLAYLEHSLAFLRSVLSSPEKRAWCRDFGENVPPDFREELGGFLLDYRSSGAELLFRDALRKLEEEGTDAFPAGEAPASMSDTELRGQLAGLMDGETPFVLYGISSGLLYRLFSELLQRRQNELRKDGAFRLDTEELPELALFAEAFMPGHGEEAAQLFGTQLTDPEAALFGFRRDGRLTGLAHVRIRHDYVEGAKENECGVAYLEGLYLAKNAGEAPARELTHAAGNWAREMGCRQLAADCAAGDTAGASLREAAGFAEVSRCICFIKDL